MNDPSIACPFCTEILPDAPTGGDYHNFRCPNCGHYQVTGSAYHKAKNLSVDQIAVVRGWIHDQNAMGSLPMISSDFEAILDTPLPSFQEKLNRLLAEIVSNQSGYGDKPDPFDPALVPVIYGKDANELGYFGKALVDMGFISRTAGGAFRITPEGYLKAEREAQKPKKSIQGFVAMSFDDDLKPPYDAGFAPGIRSAGYVPVRVDRVEHVNRIDDEIIAQVRRSRFVIADFTKNRPGVYFEAGFALGLGLPVIWCCRSEDMPDLHFDVRQYNVIIWEEPEQIAGPLQKRIEAIIGDGPSKH